MFEFKEDLLTDGRTSELVLATCFCEPRHQLYLWRCYGDNGKGVSLGFSKEALSEFAANTKGMEFKQITYYSRDDLIAWCKMQWIDFFNDNPVNDKSNIIITDDNKSWMRDIYYLGYFMKEDIHEDEHEYRLLYRPGINLAEYILIQLKDAITDDIQFNFNSQGCNFSFDLNLRENSALLNDCVIGPVCPLGTRELNYILCKCSLNKASVYKASWIQMR